MPSGTQVVPVQLDHQWVPFEIDAQVQLLAITATNALRFTVGWY